MQVCNDVFPHIFLYVLSHRTMYYLAFIPSQWFLTERHTGDVVLQYFITILINVFLHKLTCYPILIADKATV